VDVRVRVGLRVVATLLVAGSALVPSFLDSPLMADTPLSAPASAAVLTVEAAPLAETTPSVVASVPPSVDATVTLLTVGDLMCHSQQFAAARTASGYDFYPVFSPVKADVSAADIAAGNLETTLRASSPYTGYPCFKTPRSYADALKKVGFDVLTTANNHSLDGGASGVRDTAAYLTKLGLAHTGTNHDGPAIVTHDGVKIAFLAYTYGTNGIHSPFPGAVRRINLDLMKAAIASARKKADLVVVCPHWGNEYSPVPEVRIRTMARQLIDAGADIILGSHPHVVRPVEKYKGHYIVYSMGNFVSGMSDKYTDLGIMVQATIVKRASGTKVAALKVIPVFRDRTYGAGRSTYRVVNITRTLASPDSRTSAWDIARMKQYRTYCRGMFGTLL
jgi:poly-gamma-glutamate capsule biosynthesis protein CapA/YwtB (metallophosphatase superfamily)